MSGRNDFGILRSTFLSDDRAHKAADLYAERGWAHEDLAVAMVGGHIALLGLHAMLQTDDGILPGDGVAFAHAALAVPRSMAREIVSVLETSGLLRRVENGSLYLVGFKDCYVPIVEARETDKIRKRVTRAKSKLALQKELQELETQIGAGPKETEDTEKGCPSDVHRTSVGYPTVPSVPFRTVPSEPPRSGGTAAGGVSSDPLTDRERAGMRSLYAACGQSKSSTEREWGKKLADWINDPNKAAACRKIKEAAVGNTNLRCAYLAGEKGV